MSNSLVPYRKELNPTVGPVRYVSTVVSPLIDDFVRITRRWHFRQKREQIRAISLMWQYDGSQALRTEGVPRSELDEWTKTFLSLLEDPGLQLIEKAKPRVAPAVLYASDATTVLSSTAFDELLEQAENPEIGDKLRRDLAKYWKKPMSFTETP